jgi:hypothetical protein
VFFPVSTFSFSNPVNCSIIMPVLLTIHITGAIALFSLFIAVAFAVYKKYSNSYKKLSIGIVGMNVVQLVSGGAMFLSASNSMSGSQFCARLGVYVLMSLIVESVLFVQMRAATVELAKKESSSI